LQNRPRNKAGRSRSVVRIAALQLAPQKRLVTEKHAELSISRQINRSDWSRRDSPPQHLEYGFWISRRAAHQRIVGCQSAAEPGQIDGGIDPIVRTK